jgi:tetratricopeptide (TPR) repeat protein
MYSRLLLQKEDYTSLEQFLVRTYNDFVSDGLFNRSNHNDKLTLLTYLTNCFYKTKQYSKSLEFAEILNVAMKEFDGFLNEKYVFYYFNSLVLNYAIEDKEKALDVLKEAKNNTSIKKLPAYISFIYLNTSLIYFQQEKYSLASTNISRLIQQDDFLSLDKVFQLKLLIVELIIRLELNQGDRILKQVQFINKEYKSLLSQDQLKRDAQVLDLIVMVLNKEDISSKVESITSSKSDEQSRSIDIISYNDWMKTLL